MTELKMPPKKDFLPLEDAVKIKCGYCDLKDICTVRDRKERYEDADWTTRCVITPNRPGVKRKKRKKKKTTTI